MSLVEGEQQRHNLGPRLVASMPPLSAVVIAHFMQPTHAGALPVPDGEGLAGSLEISRFIRIQLCIQTAE